MRRFGRLPLGFLIFTFSDACAHPPAALMDFRLIHATSVGTPIKVTVVNADDSPASSAHVWLASCPLQHATTTHVAENSILLWASTPGTCTVAAYRTDGLVRAWSEEVNIDVVEGALPRVALRLPADVHGGPGFIVEYRDSRCFEVRELARNSEAHKAGLRVGDCLSSVGDVDVGESTGLEVAAVERALFGPVGSTVKVTATTDKGDITGEFPRTELLP